jgi:hypothetical protein
MTFVAECSFDQRGPVLLYIQQEDAGHVLHCVFAP